jgi:hypothetical protein
VLRTFTGPEIKKTLRRYNNSDKEKEDNLLWQIAKLI